MEVKLITLDPGHFHAALVQKEMYPNVAPRVHVYAPLGADLLAHLGRIHGFNSRREQPTAWELEVHTGSNVVERMMVERAGNVVVLSGRNRAKIDYILAAIYAGFHVLADKPWIISPDDLSKLQAALNTAEVNRLVAYDIMTERYEITSLLQKEMVNDAATFGTLLPGTPEDPGVYMESVHYLMKTVAGVPLRRPAWFFDTAQQGEGLTDVGTHLVDLVQWILFPNQSLDAAKDVQLDAAKRWPTVLTAADFQRVTGDADFPVALAANVRDGKLDYFCNTQVAYRLRGVHVKFDVRWDYETEAGAGDTHFALFRGSQARVEVRQGKEQQFKPELFVVPNGFGDMTAVETGLKRKIEQLQTDFPGIGIEQIKGRYRVTIPERYRVGHEAHFGAVTRQFLRYLEKPRSMPTWEKSNMMAKYTVTTKGVQLSQQART